MNIRKYTQTQGKYKYEKEVAYEYDAVKKKNIDVATSITIRKGKIDKKSGNCIMNPVVPVHFLEDELFLQFLNRYYDDYRFKDMDFQKSIIEYLNDVGLLIDVYNEKDSLISLANKALEHQRSKSYRTVRKYKGKEFESPDTVVIFSNNLLYASGTVEDNKSGGYEKEVSQILEKDYSTFIKSFYATHNMHIYYLPENLSISKDFVDEFNIRELKLHLYEFVIEKLNGLL